MKCALLLGLVLLSSAGQDSTTRPGAQTQRAPEERIFVYGAVTKPGSRVLPGPGYSLLDLYTDSLPAEDADLREVLLVRQDKTNPLLMVFDVRSMALTGDTTHNVTLRDGDILYIRKETARPAAAETVEPPDRARPASLPARAPAKR